MNNHLSTQRFRWALTTCLFIGMHGQKASAELRVPRFISDHMVLQRDQPVKLWGWADAGAKIQLRLGTRQANATADSTGRWQAVVDAQPANATGQTLEISSGADKIKIHDVLIGEVWFASGQSNMAFTLRGAKNAEQEIANSDYPGLRMFLAAQTPAATPQTDIQGEWKIANAENSPAFSAVAYFFARHLHKQLNVPIGVIKSAWGGKPCETFTCAEALATVPYGRQLLDQLKRASDQYDPQAARQRYELAMKRWQTAVAKWKANRNAPGGKRARMPRKPTMPRNPNATEGQPAVLFNGMIAPFVGYTMRGAIWYQGEANAKPGKSEHYRVMYPLMIRDWRKHWQDDFSFLTVQLANFRQPTTEPGAASDWATVQDAQRLTLKLPRTGLAVINDVGEATNIHPRDKQTVGYRLAIWALANDYRRDLVFSGPLYRSHRVKGEAIEVEFDHVGTGLKARDGNPLARFELAGPDGTWHWATAEISGSSVIVRCPQVTHPVSVRYAWADNPEGANLVNSAGLPASVFVAGQAAQQ